MELDYSYINVSLRDDLVSDVFKHLLDAGVGPDPKYDLHVTLMYDERDIPKPLCRLDQRKEFKAKIISMGKLGEAYVFHLTSPQLLEEFRLLKEAGYEHSYGTPMFHMSLGYKLDSYNELELDQVFAEWMGRELTFTDMSFGFKKDK